MSDSQRNNKAARIGRGGGNHLIQWFAAQLGQHLGKAVQIGGAFGVSGAQAGRMSGASVSSTSADSGKLAASWRMRCEPL